MCISRNYPRLGLCYVLNCENWTVWRLYFKWLSFFECVPDGSLLVITSLLGNRGGESGSFLRKIQYKGQYLDSNRILSRKPLLYPLLLHHSRSALHRPTSRRSTDQQRPTLDVFHDSRLLPVLPHSGNVAIEDSLGCPLPSPTYSESDDMYRVCCQLVNIYSFCRNMDHRTFSLLYISGFSHNAYVWILLL